MFSIDRSRLSVALLLAFFVLSACNGSLSRRASYLDGYPAFAERGIVNVVVEVPAGTNDKWQVDKANGSLQWEQKNGRPRVVQYLAYPANYGMIPRTSLPYEIGGDGDPLDVLLLGPAVDRGTVVPARPIGVLRLMDDGERDDKILAVPIAGPFSDVVDLETLDSRYRGTREIIETWFTNYKGPDRATSTGFGDSSDAMAVVQEASRHYEASAQSGE
jgi:inorganic pyrophosphatase